MRHAAAFRRPFRQMLQLHAEHRALNAFHAVIVADFVVVIAHGGAVFAQGAGALVKGGVVRHQRAAFAAGAEIFAGIKTEAGNVAERADDFALVFRAVRLRGVLDQRQLVLSANRQNRVQVERMAVKMHGHDGLGARRDGAFDELRIEIERGVVNVHINRLGADVGNRPARRDERERRGDDLVAGADAEQQHAPRAAPRCRC